MKIIIEIQLMKYKKVLTIKIFIIFFKINTIYIKRDIIAKRQK